MDRDILSDWSKRHGVDSSATFYPDRGNHGYAEAITERINASPSVGPQVTSVLKSVKQKAPFSPCCFLLLSKRCWSIPLWGMLLGMKHVL